VSNTSDRYGTILETMGPLSLRIKSYICYVTGQVILGKTFIYWPSWNDTNRKYVRPLWIGQSILETFLLNSQCYVIFLVPKCRYSRFRNGLLILGYMSHDQLQIRPTNMDRMCHVLETCLLTSHYIIVPKYRCSGAPKRYIDIRLHESRVTTSSGILYFQIKLK